MRIWWVLAIAVPIVCVILVLVQAFFGRNKNTDDSNVPPDDRYPLW